MFNSNKILKITLQPKKIILFATFFVLLFNSLVVFSQDVLKKYEGSDFQTVVFSVTNRQLIDLSDSTFILTAKVDSMENLKYIRSFYDGINWTCQYYNNLDELLETDIQFSDWLVFVHGDGKTFQGTVEIANTVQNLHQVNVLLFSWPSLDPELNSIKNFKNSLRNVELGKNDFYKLILEVIDLKKSSPEFFAGQNVSLFFHSLGNYYMELFGNDTINSKISETIFDNLIINSAAVNAEKHNEWVERLSIQKRIYINSNGGDLNLAGLNLLTKQGVQLGEMPVMPLAENANYINFTSAVGVHIPPGSSHSYYYSKITYKSKTIRNFYYTLFHGNEIDFTNGSFVKKEKYPGYSISF